MPRKGANIYKRKDNRWEARYIKEYKPNGSIKYGYCYGKTYREAKQKMLEVQVALRTEAFSQKLISKQKFSNYCDEWLQVNRNHIKETTYVKYYTILEKYIKPMFGTCNVETLSSIMIAEFSQNLLKEKKLSEKTVKDILSVLNSILKYIANHHVTTLSKIEITYPKQPKKEMRVLTREEQRIFVNYLLNEMDHYKFGILLSLFTGMRIGEVCALRWQDISLEENLIKVSATMQRIQDFSNMRTQKTKIIITTPKSDTSMRIIPMAECIAKLCETQWIDNESAFVLTGSPDKYIEPRTLQKRLESYTKDCGLEGVHFHTLRHTFATRCIEVDFEIKTLSEILGHASPRITLERYVHSSLQLKRENIKKLALFGY